MDINFRTYKKQDKMQCCAMLADTWQYDKYFPNLKKPILYSIIIFEKYLFESDYKEVIVDQDDNILGFLFGQTKKQTLLDKLKYIGFSLKVGINWLLGFYGKRSILFNIVKDMNTAEEELFKDFNSQDATLNLFFTKTRGKGLGKILLSRFESYCKASGKNNIVLLTDTDCNYGFYDKAGFNLYNKIEGCFGVIQSEEEKKSTATFVYIKPL